VWVTVFSERLVMGLYSRESSSTRTSVDPAVALSIGATVNPTYPHSLPFPGAGSTRALRQTTVASWPARSRCAG